MEHTAPSKRRKWSEDEKREILLEAETAGVSITARAHKLNAGQIFSWRKELSGSRRINNAAVCTQMQSEYIRDSLFRINTLLKIVGSASQQLLSESESKRQPIYNLSAAVNNLASATCKLEDERLLLSDRLATALLQEKQSEQTQDDQLKVLMEREAEKILLHIVKNHILPQQEQERNGQATSF